MFRSLLTISAVALISCFLASFEQAQGRRAVSTDWVRTADGWESSAVLRLEPRTQSVPTLHPALVASFQLAVSLFALMAFPSQVRRNKQAAVVGRVKYVRVRGRRRKTAFLGR
ncbi:MAG: hypothetical protein GXP26_06110 [Planctomycetes bacterium]|nr:hypothetical protein [Planctomycetota bacterium]